MKKDDKYRFSLQFCSGTEEQTQAGELLERLGNKKSTVVVAALTAYIKNHPELEAKNAKVNLCISQEIKRESLENMIREIVEERFSEYIQNSNEETSGSLSNIPSAEVLQSDIADMISNLNLFDKN